MSTRLLPAAALAVMTTSLFAEMDAAWIWSEGRGVARVFRNVVDCEKEIETEIDVTADFRYVLKIDGKIVGRGPDRDVPADWTYRTYPVRLGCGRHVFEAVVYHGGDKPLAQTSYAAGFLLRAHGCLDVALTTGKGPWKAADVDWFGYAADGVTGGAFGAGKPNVSRGSSPEFRRLDDADFGPVSVVRWERGENAYFHRQRGWRLSAAKLPCQMEAPFTATGMSFPMVCAAGGTLERVLALGNYRTAYPFLRVKGGKGAKIKVAWSESARKLAAGDFFEDVYLPDGGEDVFTTSWLRSGTIVRIRVETAAEPLQIVALDFVETRYPLDGGGSFECDLPWVADVLRICRRGLEVCAHEGVYDCPFYEQLTYLGDARVQFLAHAALTSDDRLQKRCLELFSRSRDVDGMMPMNAPCDGPWSPSATYTMIYPIALADYLTWHADREWLMRQYPGLVATMAGLSSHVNGDGLLEGLPGWCFIDWADWRPGGRHLGAGPEAGKVSAIENLFYILALDSARKVAEACGERAFAADCAERRERGKASLLNAFWDADRGAIADDPGRSRFSEHAQALAILADALCPEDSRRIFRFLLEEPSLVRVSVYFSHYLFEAFAKMERTDLILERLAPWCGYVKAGYCTPLETTEPSRSDCHGWGGHPVFDFPRHFLGIEPMGHFFESVRIAPNPASLGRIKCAMPSPKGMIDVDLEFAGAEVKGTVKLPAGLDGTFQWSGREIQLEGGASHCVDSSVRQANLTRGREKTKRKGQ